VIHAGSKSSGMQADCPHPAVQAILDRIEALDDGP
jgi:hypothetical protein